MRRVVVTGMGIWSSIGQDLQTVSDSLKQGKSGIIHDSSWLDYGLQSGLVGAVSRPDLKPYLSRRTRQMMSVDSEYAYMASRQAFGQAGISDDYLQQNEVGIIFGNDGNSHQIEYDRIMEQEHCSALIGYNALFRSITSSVVLNLSSIFHLNGISLTIGAACSSSSHAIGVASMFIREGMQDMILVGGSSEVTMSSIGTIVNDALYQDICFNDCPEKASRPFDKDAIGCIPTGGAAALVLEEYEHAKTRGATILAEVVGYGFSGGGTEELYLPYWESEYTAMCRALRNANLNISDISMIHARAESFPLSDQAEAIALSRLCGDNSVPITSTDSMTGHGGWMAGASRAVYSILMMRNGFIAPTINLDNPIEEAQKLNVVRALKKSSIETILLNTAGIGGSSAAFVLKKMC